MTYAVWMTWRATKATIATPADLRRVTPVSMGHLRALPPSRTNGLAASGGSVQRRFAANARPIESVGINRTGACMARGKQLILRMVACCAVLLLTMTTRSTFATAGDCAQQRHRDFSIVACSNLIQKNSPHLETGRPARESVQVSPQAITQAATVSAEVRFTAYSLVGGSPPANGSVQAAGGCEAYNSRHANGSTVWCSVRPAKGHVFPLGLGFSAWICRNGIWVPVANKEGTIKR